ncbi:serine protease inhibitor dipetalogastin isoform X1 [Cryptotermes secundus]|uniref:serine protease inhibitor dipetalogastin isoform X1 n=1 Tax=Cryptotermes secundus TaxID=105785 RepID=UPI000CD7D13C|nr:serine protease inhibitor dipetalogastin isoform X1 [Cryptotermes secundus]
MKTSTIIAISCCLLLNQGTNGRTRVLRQTEWENFVPTFWRPDLEDASMPETPQPKDDGASRPVVDGNGSLLGCICPAPLQFDPVCGSDGVTYGNLQKLKCARSCGKNVRLSFIGACSNG